MAQLNFFSPVNSEKRLQIIELLRKSGNDLRIKIRDQNYRSKILSQKSEDQFAIYKFIPGHFNNQEAIFSFDAEDGKFFFTGSVSTQGSDLVLTFPSEIFQLVRRNDFRVDLPPQNEYLCSIISINGTKKVISSVLRNISLGGCQVSILTSDLSVNKEDLVEIKLTIKDFEWEKIPAIVKQIRPANEKGDLTFIGVQFKEPEADFLTDVQSALMYLDRTHRHRHD